MDAATPTRLPGVAIIGGGPAGLMAAEVLSGQAAEIHLFDAMPSVGRKFLMAGKSGLNLGNAEEQQRFVARFGTAAPHLAPHLAAFASDDLRSWAAGLGIETFVGSSGRIFPVGFKAAPLLRAWVQRLRRAGVTFHMRHRWLGWQDGALRFATPQGESGWRADATILALGGASWPALGSDGAWVAPLRQHGVEVTPLRPANCGFDVAWSGYFRDRFAGQPIKPVATRCGSRSSRGEFVVTASGIEGGAVYAHAAALRDALERDGKAQLLLDLLPDRDAEAVAAALAAPRGSRSLADHLRRRAGISGIKLALLHEWLPKPVLEDGARLAAAIKALPLAVTAPRPIAEAISSAGGVTWEALDDGLMLRALPGCFAAGEMLDWEVETGGYLLTACLALGRAAGQGAADWLALASGLHRRPV